MKSTLKLFAICVVMITSQGISAGNPVEFWGCKFNEGKGMEDLDKWTQEWNTLMDALPDDGYNAWIMTPMFSSTMSAADYLWVGAWPDYEKMGSGFDDFFNGEEGSAAFAEFVAIGHCEMHELWSSKQVRENTGG